MQRNILEYLEKTVTQFPDKEAYLSEDITRTFTEVSDHARSIGSYLLHQGLTKEPVVVFMGKDPRTIESYLGTVYSGCYYVPIDEEMPKHRVELIRAHIADLHRIVFGAQHRFANAVSA